MIVMMLGVGLRGRRIGFVSVGFTVGRRDHRGNVMEMWMVLEKSCLKVGRWLRRLEDDERVQKVSERYALLGSP